MIKIDNKNYYLRDEVTKKLNISKSTLFTFIRKKRFNVIKHKVLCGNGYRTVILVPEEDLNQEILRRRNKVCKICGINHISLRFAVCKNPDCIQVNNQRKKERQKGYEKARINKFKPGPKKDISITPQEFKQRLDNILADLDKNISSDVVNRRMMSIIKFQCAKRKRGKS